jgi:hypothetical protein
MSDDGFSPLDELAAIIRRARGIEAALSGCVNLGGDRDCVEGVLALYYDQVDVLTKFEERLTKHIEKG